MNHIKTRKVLLTITRPLYVIKFFSSAIRFAKAETYWPEKTRKSKFKRYSDNIKWLLKYGAPNRFYTLYGMDVVGVRTKGYVDEEDFIRTRNDNNRTAEATSQTCILRDKYLFYKYLSSNDIATPKVFTVVSDGKAFDEKLNPIIIESLKAKKDYFIKDVGGECASFVKKVNSYGQLVEIIAEHPCGKYLLQERVIQCKEMNRLNPNAINTLRIVTVNKGGKPYVLTKLLRVGTKKTGNVDNWAAGGLAIGINDDGCLKQFGFYKPTYGLKTDIHPDSNIIFNEFKIPMYEEAVALVLKAHKSLPGIHSIGWDVAFAEEGPVLIEGNDNWEISLQQTCDRPLEMEWRKARNI